MRRARIVMIVKTMRIVRIERVIRSERLGNLISCASGVQAACVGGAGRGEGPQAV